MLNDLCGLLMRFRLHQIAIVADIEKAFLQIGIQPNQRDVTRFLWLKNSGETRVESDNIQEYRFCRVPFGLISSPFLLGATIESHLESYDSELALKLKNDIYVDNLITGADSIESAIQVYRESKSIFREASMNLREWISNNSEVNKVIDSVDSVCCDTVKVLGHNWVMESDSISLTKPNIPLESTHPTKRSVLKEIAAVFDPLGLFSPILLKGKVFLHSLWCKHLDWDDSIENEDLKQWSTIRLDSSSLSDLQVNRCIAMNGNGSDIKYHLICFCDASKDAYAAGVYLLQTSREQVSKSDLIFSKTRLAPIKKMTIPRLELMAVLIGVRCLRFTKEQLKIHIENMYLQTDAQCVLWWLNSKKDLSVFVRNRVKEINKDCDIKFGFVSTSENPADVATRGTTVSSLQNNSLWWYGPRWLKESEKEWPHSSAVMDDTTNVQYESEIKKSKSMKEKGLLNASEPVVTSLTPCAGNCAPLGIDHRRFSSITKLLRVTALALRFINRLRKSCSPKGPLTSSEISASEILWVKYIQRKNFQEVFDAILKEKSNNLKKQLGLYLDADGILRCQGRIDQATMISESARRPVLLPKYERFTHLVIEKVHKQNLHCGVSQCLSQVRYKYWIPHGRAAVKSVIQSCLVCRRHEGGPYKLPSMSPLPGKRIREATPFSRTGLDYLGPLLIRTNNGTQKVWVCLFTCLVIRAVHLELVLDMTTEEFLLALRRFISQRGAPVEITSDNALTFKSASTALELIWKNVTKHEDIQSYVSSEGIKWSFIVEMAPWMGGFYERLGLVKRAM